MTDSDLISRSALLEELKEQHDYIMQDPEVGKNMKWCEAVCFHRTVETVESAPAVDAETVIKSLPYVKEALEMAKQSLVPVVRCKDCKHSRERNEYEKAYLVEGVLICTHHACSDDCWFSTWSDHWCSYGERRADDAD